VDVELVRYPTRRGLLDRLHRNEEGGEVLFHRTFKPMGELDDIEAYAGQLELIAAHANAGTFGCFVDTTSRAGEVQITLYERSFDGRRLRCQSLAHRSFDPEDDSALVASAEFRAQLETWAEDRNEELEEAYRDAVDNDIVRMQRATDRQAAADELARILGESTP
jgi:hypothetical protein